LKNRATKRTETLLPGRSLRAAAPAVQPPFLPHRTLLRLSPSFVPYLAAYLAATQVSSRAPYEPGSPDAAKRRYTYAPFGVPTSVQPLAYHIFALLYPDRRCTCRVKRNPTSRLHFASIALYVPFQYGGRVLGSSCYQLFLTLRSPAASATTNVQAHCAFW